MVPFNSLDHLKIGQFSQHGCFSFILILSPVNNQTHTFGSEISRRLLPKRHFPLKGGSMRLLVASCDQGSKTRICVSAEKISSEAFNER